jgi:hypothetical protein
VETAKIPNVWIPVCCERVMRYNVFLQKDETAYGSMVCTVCNKNVTFELEHIADLSVYGEGARVLSLLASPKPPKDARRKVDGDAALSDQTL